MLKKCSLPKERNNIYLGSLASILIDDTHVIKRVVTVRVHSV